MDSTSNNGKQNVHINLTQKPERQNEGLEERVLLSLPITVHFFGVGWWWGKLPEWLLSKDQF